jgi:hypothetical protein
MAGSPTSHRLFAQERRFDWARPLVPSTWCAETGKDHGHEVAERRRAGERSEKNSDDSESRHDYSAHASRWLLICVKKRTPGSLKQTSFIIQYYLDWHAARGFGTASGSGSCRRTPHARRAKLANDIFAMQEESEQILGCPVDLLTRRSVEQSDNPIRRRSILESAREVYAG